MLTSLSDLAAEALAALLTWLTHWLAWPTPAL